MRAVSVWQCSCSTHLKVVSEIDLSKPPQKTTMACPGCSNPSEIDGRLVDVFYEERDGVWMRSTKIDAEL